MIPILVTIKDGVVHSTKVCNDGAELEKLFGKEIEDRGIDPCDENFDDGYFEFEDNSTVCMTWAPDGNQHMLKCAMHVTSAEEAKDFLEWVSVDAELKDPSIEDDKSIPNVDDICAQLEHSIEYDTFKETVDMMEFFLVHPEYHIYYHGIKTMYQVLGETTHPLLRQS